MREFQDRFWTEKHCRSYLAAKRFVCPKCGHKHGCLLSNQCMPNGQKRFAWRCINRIEHGKRICRDSAMLEEPEIYAALTAAMNELFRQRTAREALAECVAAALTDGRDGDLAPRCRGAVAGTPGTADGVVPAGVGRREEHRIR